MIECGSCVACCRLTPSVRLLPGFDEPKLYATTDDGTRIAPDGTGGCRYILPDGGCAVHDFKPALCRDYDCRKHMRQLSDRERIERIRNGWAPVFKAARDRKE